MNTGKKSTKKKLSKYKTTQDKFVETTLTILNIQRR